MKKLICVLVMLLAMTLGSAFAAEDAAQVCVESFEMCPGAGWVCAAAIIGIIVAAGAIAIGDKP